jgi:pimeloyl-ACP methyl ester carboxylesterase
MWHKVMPTLARRFRCIAPDLRGLGWTSAPEDGYDKPQLAADVVALLDALGVSQPVPVIGHDWGAIATLHLCQNAPDRVSKALVLSVPAPWDSNPDPRRLLGLAHMPLLSAPGAERYVPQLAGMLLRISGLSASEAEPYVAVLREPERRRATVGYYRTFVTRELPGLLVHPPARPRVPLRMLGGDRDPVCRFSPSVEHVRGAGHFLPEDQPEAVLRAAADFL